MNGTRGREWQRDTTGGTEGSQNESNSDNAGMMMEIGGEGGEEVEASSSHPRRHHTFGPDPFIRSLLPNGSRFERLFPITNALCIN